MALSQNFVENITVHGIRFIFSKDFGRISKIFWILTFFLSNCCLGYYSYNLYKKLSTLPDINIKLNEKFAKEIPYPAITICTPLFAKNKYADFHNFVRDLRFKGEKSINLTVQEQNYMASNIQACNPNYFQTVNRHTQNRTDRDIIKLMNNSFLTVPEALIHCSFKGLINNCTKIFNRVLTDRGYCYTFNLQGYNTIFNADIISYDFDCFKRLKIGRSMSRLNKLANQTVDDENDKLEWSLENGYTESHEADSVPAKAQKTSFLIANVLIKENDASNLCTSIGNTFSYYLHLPNEIMMTNFHQEHQVEFQKKKDFILKAKSYTADKGMRKFKPEARGCYFDGEKKLMFFKTYTKELCEFECMTNYTLKACGCVKFSMPRTSFTPICDLNETDCLIEAISSWPNFEVIKDKHEATCRCLKPCNDIKYEIKHIKSSALENVNSVLYMNNLTNEDAVAMIRFYFDEFQILEYEEYASYKIQNFIADVGGLLGLFLGCSLLSLVEIIHFLMEFFTMKFKIYCCNQETLNNEGRMIKNEPEDKEFLNQLRKLSEMEYVYPSKLYIKSDGDHHAIPI